jgi:DNA-binding NtrC family response regulator
VRGDTFPVDETWLTRDSKVAAGPSIPIGASLPRQHLVQSETERHMIETALAATRGRIAGPNGAAAKLGIPRQTLDSKITASVSTSIATRAAEPACILAMPTIQQILTFQHAGAS